MEGEKALRVGRGFSNVLEKNYLYPGEARSKIKNRELCSPIYACSQPSTSFLPRKRVWPLR
jgi:hypothetical protein